MCTLFYEIAPTDNCGFLRPRETKGDGRTAEQKRRRERSKGNAGNGGKKRERRARADKEGREKDTRGKLTTSRFNGEALRALTPSSLCSFVHSAAALAFPRTFSFFSLSFCEQTSRGIYTRTTRGGKLREMSAIARAVTLASRTPVLHPLRHRRTKILQTI